MASEPPPPPGTPESPKDGKTEPRTPKKAPPLPRPTAKDASGPIQSKLPPPPGRKVPPPRTTPPPPTPNRRAPSPRSPAKSGPIAKPPSVPPSKPQLRRPPAPPRSRDSQHDLGESRPPAPPRSRDSNHELDDTTEHERVKPDVSQLQPITRAATEELTAVDLDAVVDELDAVVEELDAESSKPELDPETRAIIITCESELETNPGELRAARLNYEIALAYESSGGFLEDASDHYSLALAGSPDHVPTIRGARRVHIARGDYGIALPLFEAEAKLTSDPSNKAMLYFAQGRLLEDALEDRVEARAAYAKALELDSENATILKALEQCDSAAGKFDELLETYERTSNVVAEDARHRAALIVRRARLFEQHKKDDSTAAELYETALRLDPHALGALDALKRLYSRNKEWRLLAAVLERESRQADDKRVRGLALYQVARVHGERMGNRAEAISSLAKATTAQPREVLILEDLTRLYEEQEDYDALAEVLTTRVEIANEKGEQVDLLHRLGVVNAEQLGDEPKAVQCFQSALEIDPTHVPVLQALGKLLAKRDMWLELINMHLAEAAATDAPDRGAAAHARIAEIYETHLRQATEAADHHARALIIVPGYPASFKALTRLYAQAEKFRELVELYERAIEEAKLDSLKIAYMFKVGQLWEDALGDPIQAIHAFRRVLRVEPKNLGAVHALQRVTERADRYKELVDMLELEAELVDDSELEVGLLHRAGTVLDEHMDDSDAALIKFKKALELNPTWVPALSSMGRIYFRTGRWGELLEMYERELAVTAEGIDAVALMHKMGELCETKLGDDERAKDLYRRAVKMDPTYRPAMRGLARKLREKGEWKGVVEALELEVDCLQESSSRATTYYRIGQVYEERLEDESKAIEAYEKALEQQDSYRPARVALGRLHAEGGEWMKVIDALIQDSSKVDDPLHSVNTLMQQAEIYRDELHDDELATLCFEAVMRHEAGRIPALLALETLYRKAEAWDKLADVFSQLGRVLADPSARISALRELARIQDSKEGVGNVRDRIATHEAILSIEASDVTALSALEQIGREVHSHQVLVRVYRQLSQITDNPGLKAAYLTRLGSSLEQLNDRGALEAYGAAVELDPELLTSIRGLSRVADQIGDHRAMAHAARLEAELTRKPEMAARLFVRAGIIRREQMNDLGAVKDFELALEAWPDDVQAAERIIQPLLETGQVQHLVDVLSKAADSAKSSQRKTALWLEVGSLYVSRLENLGAGIAAFKRGLDASPGHIPTQQQLAEAYQENQQWGEAVAALEQVLALTSDDGERCDAHLKLASIYDEHLKKTDRAKKEVEAVLRKDPGNADALLRLADIQLRTGNEAGAVSTAQKLVELATDPKKKGAALVRVARIERSRGEDVAADEALGDALALQGPGGDAEKEFKKSIEETGNWVGYAAGLSTHIRTARQRGETDLAPAYLELAATYADGMSLPNKAIDTLHEGLSLTSDKRLMRVLGTRLREAGRLDEALNQIQHVIAVDPTRPETWRDLALTLEQSGRRDDALRALSPLVVLGKAEDEVHESLNARARRTARAAEGSFNFEAVRAVSVEMATSAPASSLLGSIADGIGKIFPPKLERFGLTRRDRIGGRSNYPLWELAARLSQIFACEFELYEHNLPKPMVALELTETPAVVLSRSMRKLQLTQQTFLMAYAISAIATRVYPALALNPIELEVLLVGAARNVAPKFTTRPTNDEEFDDAKERLRRAVPRKWRRAMETAGGEFANNPPPDFGRWQWTIKQTSIRAGMLLADDLVDCVDAVGHIAEVGGRNPLERVQSSAAIRDMLQFWASERAATVRRRVGIG